MAAFDPGCIYDEALKCRERFDKLVAHEDDPDGPCHESQELFERWAFRHDALSRTSSCLDEKLRNTITFKTYVVSRLSRLADDITRLLNRISGTSCGGPHPLTELTKQNPQKLLKKLIFEGAKECQWVSKGAGRLQNIDSSIRAASARSKAIDMLGFAYHPDFAPFENLCSLSVGILYPYIHTELQDRLIASMTRRYAAAFHPKYRQCTSQSLQTDPTTTTTTNRAPEESNEHRGFNKADLARDMHDQIPFSSQSDMSSGNTEQGQRKRNDSPKVGSRFQQTLSSQLHLDSYPDPPRKNNNKNTITCEWCTVALTNETLEPRNWRQHVDADLMPYLCIAPECTEHLVQFPDFAHWFNHMKEHGQHWHREIYPRLTWACPNCKLEENDFFSSDRLLRHLGECHADVYTAEQRGAISRLSYDIELRAQDECLLCCYKLEKTALPNPAHSAKRRKQPPREVKCKRARTNSETSHPKRNSLSDEEPRTHNDVNLSRSPQTSKTMARHIAGHLQMLMLLTVRLASIQNDQETLVDDINSVSVNIDIGDRSSLAENFAILSDIDLQKPNEEESLDKADPSGVEVHTDVKSLVPDTEELSDWSHIPRRDFPVEEDKFLQEVVKRGAFQSHHQVRFISLGRDLGLPPRPRTDENI
ncbi:hypothetical protein GX51_07581 [Blastomyces parvus]|uniref:C2H2-type domain-containing protein n=1 Tax=Blastomyces parvus TaxID=2060905 RepID=A0A2B7WBP7_9EURO|nr:hypothetical protein GX51_07581 [Blastomyces parvus]